jgi:hypothetical protein
MAVYGVIHKEAVALDDFDLYIMLEEVEKHNMLVWIVYLDSEDCTIEEVEVETLLVLATPVHPHWEEHRAYPI